MVYEIVDLGHALSVPQHLLLVVDLLDGSLHPVVDARHDVVLLVVDLQEVGVVGRGDRVDDGVFVNKQLKYRMLDVLMLCYVLVSIIGCVPCYWRRVIIANSYVTQVYYI